MNSAGKRTSKPPSRLIDALLQSAKNKPNSKMSQTGSTVSEQSEKTEATISDLLVVMNRANEENRQRHEETRKSIEEFRSVCSETFERLNGQFVSLTDRFEGHELRITKTEENTNILHKNQKSQQVVQVKNNEKLESIIAEVETLKETVKNLPITNSANTTFQPPMHSTTSNHDTPQVSYPAISLSTSMNQSERFVDIVSEFNGQRQDLHPEKFLDQLERYFRYVSLCDSQQIDLF